MSTISKRLHISGLTPQITSEDLSKRLSSFGKITSLDGLGNLDALGKPRPFAYATLETSQGQLSKCMNLLSGTTWKGAKLRIGEAKLDYSERLQKEREEESSQPPKKRRRLARGCIGVNAADMTPVSPSNIAEHPGWRKTPLGRLIRPMRMRPLRPLPPPSSSMTTASKLRKKRKPQPLVRMRRRLLDPEAWGVEYLKGVMLDGDSSRIREKTVEKHAEAIPQKGLENEISQMKSPRQKPHPPVITQPTERTENPLKKLAQDATIPTSDIAREANQNISLLKSIFADDADDWGGEESLSDIDIPPGIEAGGAKGAQVDNDEIEPIPKAVNLSQGQVSERSNTPMDSVIEEDLPISRTGINEEAAVSKPQPVVQVMKLKDMFAPRAEDAVGFSILGNLDLDLELDDAYEAIAPAPVQAQANAPEAYTAPTDPATRTAFTLDPHKPFFFPSSLSSESSSSHGKSSVDILFLLKDDLAGFHRTEDADAIRASWEARKVDLTRDWKRRHREALKSVRRRGGLQN